jgi:cytochrome c peroxidase
MSFTPSRRVRGIRARLHVGLAFASTLAFASACNERETPTAEEAQELAGFELRAGELPASPTNRVADDAAAAALGRTLFFDRGLSSDGTVACVDCHAPEDGFADARRVSLGIEDRRGGRHALPITSAPLLPFLMWDGRADTVWRQPLLALENEREMSFTRVEVARFVAAKHRDAYESVFGPLPDLSDVPERGKPGDAEWDALPDAKRDAVQRVFVDVGKAIEAYERKLVCADTRFDRWVRGEAQLSDDELDGAARFVRSGCTSCHEGPAFSDGGFHNLGLSDADADVIDVGREGVLALIIGDPLNGAGVYSDDPAFGAERLAAAAEETRIRGAFRTASLRGVGQRERFGHRGAHTDLAEFIDDTYRGRGGRGDGDGDGRNGNGRGDGDGDGNGDDDIVGRLDPLLDDVNVNDDDARRIADFLRTLDCAVVADDLLAP